MTLQSFKSSQHRQSKFKHALLFSWRPRAAHLVAAGVDDIFNWLECFSHRSRSTRELHPISPYLRRPPTPLFSSFADTVTRCLGAIHRPGYETMLPRFQPCLVERSPSWPRLYTIRTLTQLMISSQVSVIACAHTVEGLSDAFTI